MLLFLLLEHCGIRLRMVYMGPMRDILNTPGGAGVSSSGCAARIREQMKF